MINTIPNPELMELKENYLRQSTCKQQCFVFTDISELEMPEITKYPVEKFKNGSIHSFQKEQAITAPPTVSRSRRIITSISLVLLLIVIVTIIPLALQLRSSSLLEARLAFIRRLLNEGPLIEGYWRPQKSSYFNESVEELKDNMVGAILWPIAVPCGAQHLDAVQLALEGVDYARRNVSNTFGIQIVGGLEEMEAAHADGMISAILGIEGHSLGSSLGVLRSFHSLGIRWMSLTAEDCTTPWAASSLKSTDLLLDSTGPVSLTSFGQTILLELNRLGIVAEISRLSEPSMMSVLNHAKAPLLLSSALPSALCNSTSTIPDHILSALSLNGGVIMLNVDKCGKRELSVKESIQIINYVRAIAGVDHLGLSSAPKNYPLILAELARDRLWGNVAIKKLVGGNIARVIKDADAVKHNIGGISEDMIPNEDIESNSYCRYPES